MMTMYDAHTGPDHTRTGECAGVITHTVSDDECVYAIIRVRVSVPV